MWWLLKHNKTKQNKNSSWPRGLGHVRSLTAFSQNLCTFMSTCLGRGQRSNAVLNPDSSSSSETDIYLCISQLEVDLLTWCGYLFINLFSGVKIVYRIAFLLLFVCLFVFYVMWMFDSNQRAGNMKSCFWTAGFIYLFIYFPFHFFFYKKKKKERNWWLFLIRSFSTKMVALKRLSSKKTNSPS